MKTSIDADLIEMFLHGPLQNAKKLTKETLENKALGKIDSDGESGEIEKRAGVTMEIRFHPKAPFGVVEWYRDSPPLFRGERRSTIRLELIEVGKNAKSELPDQK